MLRDVRGIRLGSMAVVAVALALFAGSCGSDSKAGSTMPAMIETTVTSSTVYVTTTTIVSFYVVQSGDTLSKIAGRFGVAQADLMALNGITNPDHIEKGKRLKIPPPKQVTTTQPAGSAPPST